MHTQAKRSKGKGRRGGKERRGSHPARRGGLPSREQITGFLAEGRGPQALEAIAGAFGIEAPRARAALERRLESMVRAGQILRNRRGAYGPVEKMELFAGRVSGHPDGYGFLVRDAGGEDVYLSEREMQGLLHGDRAVVRVTGADRRGRPRGTVVEVLERANTEVVGRFHEEGGMGFVVPDNRRIAQDILVPREDWGRAASGNIVVAEIVRPPDRRHQPIGRVTEILGEALSPTLAVDIAIRAHELPRMWPEAVREEAASVPGSVDAKARTRRRDLRDLPLVTIDGEDARDFDDAVYCERTDSGWRLLVAIADVSHYVKPGSALDEEAHARGNSAYFPDRVIPMLPEELSNGICSLNPEVDRLCMVCELHLDNKGEVQRHAFHEAVMRSAARLTYTEVARILVERDQQERARRRDLVPHLEDLHALFGAFARRRAKRGAIEFDSVESRVEFDASGGIERIVPVERNDAHRIIEECMIAANVAAAWFLIEHELPSLFRVHAPPPEDRVADLRTFLSELGLSLGRRGTPTPGDYARLIEAVEDRPDRHLINTILLRSLQLAVYSSENIGHFGLAFDAYTHFTSPIRRYPDLLVHRAIRKVLRRQGQRAYPYDEETMQALGEHCSMTERRADDATRDAMAWLKCEYMADRVGEYFDGVVSSVTSFGLFVELDQIYIDGLVHITSLPNDYYHFDPVRHRLEGERTGRSFSLLDPVRVQLTRVDLDERKIDFDLCT